MSENKKAEKIVGVKGMNDILPADAPLWELFENTVYTVLKSYGFQQIRTPIVEPTALFSRGLGEVTDIVEKEMYSFVDSMNGDNLTLRPENTASVVRAALEHNLTYDGPKRLWYAGPMFRHERPQRGRYRQFHQVGAEAIGFTGPDIDAELIMMCQRLWDDLGLENIRLELNSIGDAEERNKHRVDLIAYFEQHKSLLDADAQRRLHSNPLRILDTKNPAMQAMVNAAPQLINYLGEESRINVQCREEISDFNCRCFDCVGTVHSVGIDRISEVSTDGAFFCFFRIGCAHQVAMLQNGVFAFQHLSDDRTGDHEINQILEERTLAVNRVKTFCFSTRQMDHARSDDLQACGFETGINLADHVFRDCIRLDNRKGAFNCHV